MQGHSLRPKLSTAVGKIEARTISAKVNLSSKKYFPFPNIAFFKFSKKKLDFSYDFFKNSGYLLSSGLNLACQIGVI